jgi:hypothetical protein
MQTPDELIPGPSEFIPRNTPDTIAGWRAVADGFLSDPCCAFHRNVEISSCYAWIHQREPACFKWAAMAAIASHHVRLALYPLRLDADRTGFVDIPHSLGRRRLLLTQDVDTIRATNNAIFNDIFWAHLAYVSTDDGIERLRALLQAERHYAPVLAGFEAIDRGRRVLADATASAEVRQAACDLIWQGNVELLRHEQRAVVQPCFDRLSCAFARLISIGSATSFEVRGVRREVASFTSFYLYSLSRESRMLCGRRRGRGSPASTTAGAGSWPASFPASGESMPTRAWSPPPCGAFPTKRATSRRPRASCPTPP